ncbi:MAG TPA: SIS domain-containing protein [Patescibacteria group bacterium]|nr:SIS domain-containing protein [Patescibacteria group bacterium]
MANSNNLYRKKSEKHLLETIRVNQLTINSCTDSILAASQLIVDTFLSGGKVLLCGNGGSAADCQHIAAEFVNMLDKNLRRPTLPAFALTADSSVMTAFSNDFGFEGVFERQVQGLGQKNDLLIGISTSGNSKNIVRAIRAANEKKMHTLALTGDSGRLIKLADRSIAIPSKNTQHIQESLLVVEHILCEIVEHYLFVKLRKKEIWS